VEVSAKLFAAKYNSKREVFNFLAVDVGVYLPHFDLVTIYFLKDLAHGKKKCKRTRSSLIDEQCHSHQFVSPQ